MRIAVIGHSGMCGKELVDLLVARGHEVTGIARQVSADADERRYRSIAADVFDVAALTRAIAGHDVVVSVFSGGHGVDLPVYYRQIEGTRRIIQAFKAARGGYLVYQGGAASLYVKPGVQMYDDPRFPAWYFGIMPPAHLRWLGGLVGLPPFLQSAERKARGELQPYARDLQLEEQLKDWKQIPLLEGCRVALDLFEARRDFDWSFLSPPWLLRPGRAAGQYEVGVDFMMFRNGVPAGISVADLALALADEVENRMLVHKHWTVAGPQDDF
jgi:uncharacterized protein